MPWSGTEIAVSEMYLSAMNGYRKLRVGLKSSVSEMSISVIHVTGSEVFRSEIKEYEMSRV